jgi:hypothetical protein
MAVPSIDFALPDLHAGFTEIKGAVYLDDEFLVLDMEVASLAGLKKSDRIIKIEPRALSYIFLRRGLVKDKICLRPKRDDLLEAVPGSHRGDVQLRVWRTRRLDAKLLVQEVRRRMADAESSVDEEAEAP